MVEGVALRPDAFPGKAVEEGEGGHRLEDRAPYRVEVDGAGHHRDEGLVGRQLGRGHVADVNGFGGVLLGRAQAFEHGDVIAADEGGPVALGKGEGGQLRAGRSRQDRLEDLLHAAQVTDR